MAPKDACLTTSQLSIQSGTHLDNSKSASQARSRSTSTCSSPGSAPGSDFSSIAASVDCQVAIPAGPPGLSALDHSEALFDIDQPLLLGVFGEDDRLAAHDICPPPGLESATPAARSFVQLQDDANDENDDDAFAWAVASLAAEMALGSPTSASGRPTPVVPAEAINITLPVLSVDPLTYSNALHIPRAPGFPPPPPLQAPVLGSKRSPTASCAPPASVPSLAPQTKPAACAPSTQSQVLSTHTNFPSCAPPLQPPVVASHMQRSPMLPPPAVPPSVNGKPEEPQFFPAPMLPPRLASSKSQLHFAPPPCQPPALGADMQQHVAPPPCRPPVLGAEMQTPVDVPPPAQAPILRLAEAFPEPALDTPSLPSVGSGSHHLGTCKPCAFFHTKGCGNGVECQFCHLCTPGEKKRRMKEKRRGEGEQRGQTA